MQLIGMLDSPFVRRVAISLHAMGLPFEHRNWSVFGDFDRFAAVNPAVKAPTLVADDGTVLQDSTLILEYLERLATPDRRLLPTDPDRFLASQRLIGLALAACEKSVQIVYERRVRPPEKQHQPWIDRVARQLQGALDLLTIAATDKADWLVEDRLMQADITTAVAWRFARSMLPEFAPVDRYVDLSAFADRAETTGNFRAAPFVG